jgi:hypothetical protein
LKYKLIAVPVRRMPCSLGLEERAVIASEDPLGPNPFLIVIGIGDNRRAEAAKMD